MCKLSVNTVPFDIRGLSICHSGIHTVNAVSALRPLRSSCVLRPFPLLPLPSVGQSSGLPLGSQTTCSSSFILPFHPLPAHAVLFLLFSPTSACNFLGVWSQLAFSLVLLAHFLSTHHSLLPYSMYVNSTHCMYCMLVVG